ncbi:hypothetical protein LTR96_005174 [Exophiala xenobiotica]|nr:hypothetical protein LTR72_006825 [Exophiala xenobiotica]KAK5269478.1 hypothetical protein LTR96_005174 [Exophiala xenobiotica]KAK5286144.1 hypothetical protein LTR14_010398 [Exophiala xenobiotica]KAK5339396.1 hypothetical protein LTR98_004197 [Exophiala xenobiotica]KAK5474240.1 hypothetical protein LTR55_010027 [Exophiala xenobiotica]
MSPKGPYKLVTVNTAPERAKRLIGRVVEALKDQYTIQHMANCETIDAVEPTVKEIKPDVLFCASMWTPEESARIQQIAKDNVPGIKTHAIPQGLQVEKGPDAVVEYLKEQIPGLLGFDGCHITKTAAEDLGFKRRSDGFLLLQTYKAVENVRLINKRTGASRQHPPSTAIMHADAQCLKICILGAGMGGLTCALGLARAGFKDITVFEMASNLGFVGAGIQMAPNMARILDRLGVWDDIFKEAVVLNETDIRQGATDAELGHVDLKYIKETYGYPHTVGHRATLAGELYNGCKRESDTIKFIFATTGENLKFEPKPSFTAVPRSGEPYQVECDILLGADGVKSNTRVAMLRELNVEADVNDTNQAAYRIMLTREQMASDPELLALIDADKVIRWIGEKRHIIAYPVSRKQIYNISTTQPDVNFAAAPSATYTTKASKKAMLEVFGDFCPMIHRMLDLVPEGEVCEWKLRVHAPLPTWVHGSVALVGDACHPTLPHMAQGAAQAIEDAGVLSVVLAALPSGATPADINKALKLYETVRKERAEALVELAAASGRAMHLGEGKAKEERDRQFAALKAGKGPVPDKWADADVQKMVYGVDCMKIAEEMVKSELNGA